MNTFRIPRYFAMNLLIVVILLTTAGAWAEIPVPSQWQGEITGQVHNTPFRLPVVIEFNRPLPYENNPLHIFVGAGDPNDMGHLYLSSALELNTSRGPATLQYLTISMQGSQLQARLSDDHRAEAAKSNGFSGPNVSAEQASDLMKGVLRDVLGATEMFGFDIGATLAIHIDGSQLSGTIQGSGSSYTGTSSQVKYRANLTAMPIR